MDKEGGDQGPDAAMEQVGIAENEILLGERRVLLPGPQTRRDAENYEKGIRSQLTPCRSAVSLSHSRRNCELLLRIKFTETGNAMPYQLIVPLAGHNYDTTSRRM